MGTPLEQASNKRKVKPLYYDHGENAQVPYRVSGTPSDWVRHLRKISKNPDWTVKLLKTALTVYSLEQLVDAYSPYRRTSGELWLEKKLRIPRERERLEVAKLEAFAYEQAGRPNVPFLRPNTDKEDQEERVAETLARMVAEMSDYTEPGQPVKGSKWVSHYRPPGESRFIEEGD